jgi:hypothetical protein
VADPEISKIKGGGALKKKEWAPPKKFLKKRKFLKKIKKPLTYFATQILSFTII